MMSKLLVKPKTREGRVLHVTPASAGWTYVGFDLWKLGAGQTAKGASKDRETCLVFVSGKGRVNAETTDLGVIGERLSPFEGKPWSVYVPAGKAWSVAA
jgi:5-deoxy-glucuronate isomerase